MWKRKMRDRNGGKERETQGDKETGRDGEEKEWKWKEG